MDESDNHVEESLPVQPLWKVSIYGKFPFVKGIGDWRNYITKNGQEASQTEDEFVEARRFLDTTTFSLPPLPIRTLHPTEGEIIPIYAVVGQGDQRVVTTTQIFRERTHDTRISAQCMFAGCCSLSYVNLISRGFAVEPLARIDRPTDYTDIGPKVSRVGESHLMNSQGGRALLNHLEQQLLKNKRVVLLNKDPETGDPLTFEQKVSLALLLERRFAMAGRLGCMRDWATAPLIKNSNFIIRDPGDRTWHIDGYRFGEGVVYIDPTVGPLSEAALPDTSPVDIHDYRLEKGQVDALVEKIKRLMITASTPLDVLISGGINEGIARTLWQSVCDEIKRMDLYKHVNDRLEMKDGRPILDYDGQTFAQWLSGEILEDLPSSFKDRVTKDTRKWQRKTSPSESIRSYFRASFVAKDNTLKLKDVMLDKEVWLE